VLSREREYELTGARRPRVVLAGHSHAIALLLAVRTPAARRLGAAVLFPRDRSSGYLSDAGYRDAFERAVDGRTAVVVWDGNQHIASFLVEAAPGFQVYRPGIVDADHDLGRPWVSEEMLRSLWRGDAPWTTDALEHLLHRLTATADRVVLLGTPPPKPDRIVREALGADPFFGAVLERESYGSDTVPLTPGPMRLAMWGIVQDIYRDVAADAGARFVPVPTSVTDDEGYLQERFSPPGDTSHANADYGAVMWEQLASALGGPRA
jgi:hypothetical protein